MIHKRIIAGLSALLLSVQVIPSSAISAVETTDNLKEISIQLEEMGDTTDLTVQVMTDSGYSEEYKYEDLIINLSGSKSLYVPCNTTTVTFIDNQYTEAKNDDAIICTIYDLNNYSSVRKKYKINGMYKPYELIFNPSTDVEVASIILNTYVEGDITLDGELQSNDLLVLKQRILFDYNIIQTGAYEQEDNGGTFTIGGKNNYCSNNLTLNGNLYSDNNMELNFNSGNINGFLTVKSGSSININCIQSLDYSSHISYSNLNLNKDILLTDDDVNKLYFSNDISVDNNTEITEQNLTIDTDKIFSNDITFNASNCMNLNASIKANGNININGEVHNSNNAIIYSKENITIENDSTFSFIGMIYAPSGTVTINANNVNITGCIIAKEIIIHADTINFNVNSFTKYENENISKVLSELQMFIADINYDGIVDNKDLDVMKRIILDLDRDSTYIPYEEWSTLEDSDGDGIPDIFAFDNWENLNDWDEDGIPDSVESYFGTHRYIKDTDDDSLTDYEELFYTYTDPTIYDSYQEGVADGTVDMDEDGLNNLQELYHDTDPLNADSDNDGLSDYDEIFEYSTNPLLYDTDEDGVSDGKEILISTNPLVWDSNNIVDYNYNLDSTFGIVKRLSFTTSACACETLEIENLSGIDTMTENVVGAIGVPIKISDSNNSIEKIKTDWFLDYNDICETLNVDNIDLNDIDILYYNEAEQQYEIVEKTITDTSEENLKSISFGAVNNGTYIAIYTPTWTSAWKNAPDYTKDADINIGYNTVLTIDCSGSMGGNRMESVISSATSYIEKNINNNDKTAIVSFTNTAITQIDFSTNKASLKKTVKDLKADGGTNIYAGLRKSIDMLDTVLDNGNKNIIILLSDGEDNSNLNDLLNEAKNKGIIIYTIALDSNADRETLNNIATKTGGCLIGINTSSGLVNDMYEPIEYMKGIDTITDNDEDGLPDYYEQTGIQLINGQFIPGNELKTCSANSTELNKKSSADTDNDGLLDGEEIQAKYISEYMLSKDVIQPNANKLTFVMKSDPRKVDSDNDGIPDGDGTGEIIDTAPMTKGLADGIVGNLTIVSANGHSFLIYQSLVNDILDFSNFTKGYDLNTCTLVPPQKYEINPNEYVSIGNAGDEADHLRIYKIWNIFESDWIDEDLGGIYFNREFAYEIMYKDIKAVYSPNSSLTVLISNNQLREMISTCNVENYYNLAFHNCATTAINIWNVTVPNKRFKQTIFPSNLKSQIEENTNSKELDIKELAGIS